MDIYLCVFMYIYVYSCGSVCVYEFRRLHVYLGVSDVLGVFMCIHSNISSLFLYRK